jgi:hypothetical protein
MKPVYSAVAIVGLLLTSTIPGWAQGSSGTSPITGITMTTNVVAQGQVTAVDLSTRAITVMLTNGRSVSGKVSEGVGGFNLVKVGDRVEATLDERLSFVLSAPNTATPTNRELTGLATSRANEMPAGYIATYDVSTWTVVKTDIANNTISLVEPSGGQVLIFDVRTAEGRASLPRVKPGDKLTAVKAEFLFAQILRKP